MKKFFTEVRKHGYLNPYIILEIGVNHEGDLSRAKKMIEEIAQAGGNAAKFQSYKAEKIATESFSPYYWDLNEEPSESQYQLFKKYDSFGEKEYQALAEHCNKVGIDFVSTPFDLEAVDMLLPLVPFFKIASADITNIPLLRKIGKTGKPVVISSGASTDSEVELGLSILEKAGCHDITLLHCVLNYPTEPQNAQLSCQKIIAEKFGSKCLIGYSDHVKPSADGTLPALELSVVAGAVVLEKHFTDNKTLKGNDHYHSMDKVDLAKFVEKTRLYKTLYGGGARNLELEKMAIKNARRRIVSSKEIKAGEKITENSLIALRSNIGIEVAEWDKVIGRVAKGPIANGTPVVWELLE